MDPGFRVPGLVAGALVGATGIGALALFIGRVLVALHPSLPAARVAGVDIAHVVPLTLVGGFGHFRLGNVDTGLALALLCAGARLAFAGL